VLDPLTRTARVRALLENKDGLLRPEMYANSTIKIDLGKGLAVPSDAIFRTGKENIIFVSLGEGRFEPRSVVTGLEGAGFTEIKSGLAEGERVVTSGNFLIDSESRLKAALGAMGGHQHGQ
jgi:Cu(I)/Ag(I) efflux system membrane fusion protein